MRRILGGRNKKEGNIAATRSPAGGGLARDVVGRTDGRMSLSREREFGNGYRYCARGRRMVAKWNGYVPGTAEVWPSGDSHNDPNSSPEALNSAYPNSEQRSGINDTTHQKTPHTPPPKKYRFSRKPHLTHSNAHATSSPPPKNLSSTPPLPPARNDPRKPVYPSTSSSPSVPRTFQQRERTPRWLVRLGTAGMEAREAECEM